MQKSSDKKKSPLAKSPRLPVMDAQKTNTTAKDVDQNSALPMGKNAINAKRRASLLSSATARQSLMLPASDLANRNKY